MEVCVASDSLCSSMLASLSLDRRRPDHVVLFSKGVLVALTQTLPCCSASRWRRLLGALRRLISSGLLHVPFSLEYVDFLPLLDLRRFAGELRLSVLLLRALQLLCGASCSHWLPPDGWAHVGRLYAAAAREMAAAVRDQLTPPAAKEASADVMMPGGQSEALFLCSLEILGHYEAVMAAFPGSSSALESDNTRHFFSTITDNLQSAAMRAVLRQKIAQLGSPAA
ncbi:Gem-associated protein 4 [Liparis tanakae]|uniref:Gem-associated protein 4 n=1 Tax=Liparis tanakae TaxID=230148 RepID=A0A4Z2ED26_9TELE|nr:Gem-associated protein 4 [Liparis tanakae]